MKKNCRKNTIFFCVQKKFLGQTCTFTQCGNYRIFLSLRFYVKSNFSKVVSKAAILKNWETLNWFLRIFALFESYQINKIQNPSNIQNYPFLQLLDSPKLVSPKIWVTEKSCNFHTIFDVKIQFFVKTTLGAITRRDKAMQWRLFPSGRQKRMNKRISDAVARRHCLHWYSP